MGLYLGPDGWRQEGPSLTHLVLLPDLLTPSPEEMARPVAAGSDCDCDVDDQATNKQRSHLPVLDWAWQQEPGGDRGRGVG